VFDTITTHLLTGELRLVMSEDSAGALAVWLGTPSELTQLVDTRRYDRVPGILRPRHRHTLLTKAWGSLYRAR